jgi:hypothetical protein
MSHMRRTLITAALVLTIITGTVGAATADASSSVARSHTTLAGNWMP